MFLLSSDVPQYSHRYFVSAGIQMKVLVLGVISASLTITTSKSEIVLRQSTVPGTWWLFAISASICSTSFDFWNSISGEGFCRCPGECRGRFTHMSSGVQWRRTFTLPDRSFLLATTCTQAIKQKHKLSNNTTRSARRAKIYDDSFPRAVGIRAPPSDLYPASTMENDHQE